ncbi:MAG: hypothetical protein OXE95_13245 [Chloroflexi bacterium]|nr:hypothetical protein [Chloroflexota bacterium]MCY4248529.1 hypothetical protein [Chloroflexota bacterium]
MNARLNRVDMIMTRLLLVNADAPAHQSSARQAENALTLSLMFSGARCLLQYALLPFLLPLLGVAADVAVPILLLINLLAMVSIFFSLRRFWTIGYAHRWRYLVVAATALLLLAAFTAYDIMQMSAA